MPFDIGWLWVVFFVVVFVLLVWRPWQRRKDVGRTPARQPLLDVRGEYVVPLHSQKKPTKPKPKRRRVHKRQMR